MAITTASVTSMGITSAQVAEPSSRSKEAMVTKVSGSATTMPAFFSPMKAINSPTPAGMVSRTGAGMASKIFRRRPLTVSRTKAIPSSSTRSRALA